MPLVLLLADQQAGSTALMTPCIFPAIMATPPLPKMVWPPPHAGYNMVWTAEAWVERREDPASAEEKD